MKHESTLRRELGRVRVQLKRDDLLPNDSAEQYGAQQALSWALGQNACQPSKLTPQRKPK